MSCRIVGALFLGAMLGAASAGASESAIRVDERLSDWILRQPQDSRAYAPGLFWQVPEQGEEQAKLKHHLLVLLAVHEKTPSDARQRLARMIEALPVTGRAVVPMSDPRWLQAHPDQDPILAHGHSVKLPSRPGSVSVIADNGQQCLLPHRTGLEARDYLNACQPDAVDRVDHVWLIQPDGTARQFGIALWNEQAQDEPAPGAQIWAPARDTARDTGWSPRFSALLAEFLSTQDFLVATSTATAQRVDIPVRTHDERRGPARDGEISASDWGLIGLLQTPTARMSPSGEARFHYSRVAPYARSNIILQPIDWLEAGFRYTNITNRLYGPAIAGDQTYKDKSFDFKVKVTKELAHLPQIAVGVNDVGGTGLFSSEYVVASKRTGDFDWSLGIGWGYLAGSGNIRNPFSLLSKGFETRIGGAQSAQGGTINTQSFFHGASSLFGGVQYQSPSKNLLLKAEYDANDYRREPQDNHQKQSSHVNFGLVYRYHPSLDLTAGIERGNTLMLGLTFHGALDKMSTPKLSDAPMVPVLASRPTGEPNWNLTAAEIVDQSRWSVRRISREGGALHVVLEDPYGANWNQRIERIVAILHRDAPAEINRFVLAFVEHDIPMTERVILRDAWVKRHLSLQAMTNRIEDVAAVEPRSGLLPGKALWARNDERALAFGLVPHYQQNLGGPDGFLLYQAGIAAPMKLKLTESIAITGRANLGVLDNYDNFKYDGPSLLPRVRTSLREYQTSSALTLQNLQITHVGRASHNQFYSLYGGYLENMFAGVGGEWLYRPWHSRLALGIDVNHVRQRDFKGFGLRDYSVNTGHATLYLDTGWKSTHVNFSVGRYLAGDLGGTVDISRTFRNGVTVGAWATKTDVSSEEFGEGSFDKGIYVSIPFDVLMTSLSPATANLVWSPLTRDGGAKLSRSYGLYGLTNPRDKRQTSFAPANSATPFQFDEDGPQWVTEHRLFDDIGKATSTFASQLASGQTGSALLLGGGMVLAASVLDRPMSKWADNHQSARWNTLGEAANAIPIVLAAGAGVLWLGAGGDAASETAWSAIKAAAFTLGAETVTKYAVGRARPDQNLGPTDFSSSFRTGATNSSFPSIHMGVAFATVAPFAQQYDAPWLYAVAGLTAFGRIQQREHFVSDVVAGGLIGYGIGSLMLDQQRSRRGAPRIALGSDRSIQASWDW